MKKQLFLLTFLSYCLLSHSQTTLAIQDFEVTPTTPTWSFTGTPNYVSGVSGSNTAPANSPLGIANSRSWETNNVGTGQMLEFNNITIPAGYEQIVFTFKLAAMDLSGLNTSSHGPDNLDYVLVEYSNDNGATYYRRLRIRGAINDDSFWAFDASGVAIVDYQPTSEVLFQPTNTGLATTYGYSTVGLKFPGATNQVKIRITARSSSILDSWLVDNVRLLGVNTPSAPIATSQNFCNSGTVANLVATGETDSTFNWYNVATGGTALAPTTILSTGTYYVSQTSYGLVSSRTSVSVVVGTPPTVDAGPATVTYCANAITPITVVGNGNGFQATYAPANWTFANSNADGNVNTTNAPASITLTGGNNNSNNPGDSSYSMAFATATTVSFNWTSSTNPNDFPTYDYPQVLVNGIPTLFQGYVANDTAPLTQSGTMTVNVPAGQTFAFNMHTNDNGFGAANITISNLVISQTGVTYSWAATNGGTITGATNTASITPATSGTYTVTATNTAGCIATDSVAVTINTTPAPTGTATQSFCGSATVASLVATGTALKWYDVATGGTALATTTALATGTYYVSQTLNSCESERTTVSVTLNTTPAPTAANQWVCYGTTFANVVATGTALQWYDAATGGTAYSSTAIVPFSQNYYVSQTINGCESPRIMVEILTEIVGAPQAPLPTLTVTVTGNCDSSGGIYEQVADVNGKKSYNYNAGFQIFFNGTYWVAGLLGEVGIPQMEFFTNTDVSNGIYPPTTGWVNLIACGDNPELNNVLTLTINSTSQQFCTGATVADIVIIGSTISPTTINWFDVATGGTALASTTAITTGTYYASQTSQTGCEGGRTAVTVTVNPITTPTFTAITPFCSGSTAPTLSATSVNGITGTWSPTTVSNTTSGTYTFTPTAGQCASTTTLNVTVNPLPTVDAGPATATYCANAITPITATAATTPATSNGFQGAYAPANWTFANNNADGNVNTTNTPASITITGGDNGGIVVGDSKYSKIFSNNATVSFNWAYTAGINDTAAGDYPEVIINGTHTLFQGYNNSNTAPISQSGTMTINVLAGQTFAFNMHSIMNLLGAGIVTINNLVISSSDVSYSWIATNGGSITGATNTASMTPATSGTYTVTATNTTGCSATDSVAVTINSTPAPTGTATQSFCSGETVSQIAVTGTGIIWYTAATGGTVITGSTLLVSGTTYYASQTVLGCESATRLAVTMTAGGCLGTDNFDTIAFHYYPNPTSTLFNIDYNKNIDSVTVINLLGQIVLENKTNTTNVQVDLSNLPTATYLVKVKADGNEKTVKVIKQ